MALLPRSCDAARTAWCAERERTRTAWSAERERARTAWCAERERDGVRLPPDGPVGVPQPW